MPNLADTLRGILAWHSTLLTRAELEALEQAIRLAESIQEQQRHPVVGGVPDPLAEGPEV